MEARAQLCGVVLCRVGPHRLAFAADTVQGIEALAGLAHCAQAGALFGLSPQEGRALIGPEGSALGVDSLEIVQDAYQQLPLPELLRTLKGGYLEGFIATRDSLWPLVRLKELVSFLDSGGAAAP